jgi:hypothetical protein
VTTTTISLNRRDTKSAKSGNHSVSFAPEREIGTLLLSLASWRFRSLLLLLFLAVAGCAPRQAFVRPADGQGRAVTCSSLTGVRLRVPPGAADSDAWAVAALSPLVRGRENDDRAEVFGIVEFRNKRDRPIIFVPGRLVLTSAGGEACRPTEVKVAGVPVSPADPCSIQPWSERRFAARFDLPAAALEADSWRLDWSYRWAGREYPQATRFERTDRPPCEWAGPGGAAGVSGGGYRESASGVPLLMDVPFLGALFRSGSRSACSGVSLEMEMSDPGTTTGGWWETGP